MNAEASHDHVPGMIALACVCASQDFGAAVYWTDGISASVTFDSARDAWSWRRMMGDARLLGGPLPASQIHWFSELLTEHKTTRFCPSGRPRPNPLRTVTYYRRDDLLDVVPAKHRQSARRLSKIVVVAGVEWVHTQHVAMIAAAEAANVPTMLLPVHGRMC